MAAGEQEPRSFSTATATRAFEFLVNGVPRGVNAGVVQAIGRVLGREVQLKLTKWAEAQRLVSEGVGDALTFMARTPDREKFFDFTQPTTPLAFSLFVREPADGRCRSAAGAGLFRAAHRGYRSRVAAPAARAVVSASRAGDGPEPARKHAAPEDGQHRCVGCPADGAAFPARRARPDERARLAAVRRARRARERLCRTKAATAMELFSF